MRFGASADGTILRAIWRDAGLMKQALQRLDASADGVFADLDPAWRETAAAALREAASAPLVALIRWSRNAITATTG